jgi:hypothetical protein
MAPTPAGFSPVAQGAPYAQPVPTGGGSALKIILIVIGVFVALGILGASIFAYTIWRATRGIHVDSNGDKVSISTPGGTISTDASKTFSSSDLGVDPYPGATNGHGGSKMDTPSGSLTTSILLTSDSKDKVVTFYKDKLGSAASVFNLPTGAMISAKKPNHESVMITVSAASGSDNGGKTQITIIHTKSNK